MSFEYSRLRSRSLSYLNISWKKKWTTEITKQIIMQYIMCRIENSSETSYSKIHRTKTFAICYVRHRQRKHYCTGSFKDLGHRFYCIHYCCKWKHVTSNHNYLHVHVYKSTELHKQKQFTGHIWLSTFAWCTPLCSLYKQINLKLNFYRYYISKYNTLLYLHQYWKQYSKEMRFHSK